MTHCSCRLRAAEIQPGDAGLLVPTPLSAHEGEGESSFALEVLLPMDCPLLP